MKGLTALAACCTLSLFSSSLLADDASCKTVRLGAVGCTGATFLVRLPMQNPAF